MEKLEEMYLRYGKVMLYAAYKVLGDTALAEDAVQNAFLTIVKCPQHVLSIPIDDMKPYLIVVSENAARKIYKAHHKFEEIPLDEVVLMPYEKSSEDAALSRISLTNILKMPQIAPKFRDVIVLRYYYDLDTRSIAHSLGISVSNVRARLSRARKIISELIKDEGIENE